MNSVEILLILENMFVFKKIELCIYFEIIKLPNILLLTFSWGWNEKQIRLNKWYDKNFKNIGIIFMFLYIHHTYSPEFSLNSWDLILNISSTTLR